MHPAGKELSVGELLALLKSSLIRAFPSLCVVGEVVDPFLSRNGHLYLRLRDAQGEIKVVMWRREAARLRTLPAAGDRVVARGSLTVFESKGELQFQALALAKEGLGEKLASLVRLREKLQAEGLFDRPKRAIPLLPRRLGVVTSLGSAVLHDIHQCVRRRNPAAEILLSPSQVSGREAPAALGRALAHLRDRVDLVIIARGGGSFEELLPFSDEALARQVAAFPVPVISAIGHGSDHTILDSVADATAPTPTAAAELATPVRDELLAAHALLRGAAEKAMRRRLEEQRRELFALARLVHRSSPLGQLERVQVESKQLRQRLERQLERRLLSLRAELDGLSRQIDKHPWTARVERQRAELSHWNSRLDQAVQADLKTRREEIRALRDSCRQLGPMEILGRGFALVLQRGVCLTSAKGRSPGDQLELLLADGRLSVTVNTVSLVEETP